MFVDGLYLKLSLTHILFAVSSLKNTCLFALAVADANFPNVKVANCKYNIERILGLIEEAEKNHVKILEFPELSISGYTCADLFYQQLLIEQSENALKIAQWLQTHPAVTDVYYVGLPSHPGYGLQRCQASGNGSMISFKVKSADLAKKALGKLHLICFAESLGGVETLLTYPLAQTHAEMPAELLARTGLDDRLLRLSVGIEEADDIIADLDQALQD